MTYRLFKHSVNPRYMVKNRVEDHKLNIVFFFVKNLQFFADIFSQLFPIHRPVIFCQILLKQYRSVDASARHLRETILDYIINLSFTPLSLFRVHQSILEQSQSFMSIQSHQIFHSFESCHSFIDRVLPPCQLSRRVYIMGLHVLSESLLLIGVVPNHSFCQVISMRFDSRYLLEHGSVEGTIDLHQRVISWEVH